MTALLFVYQLLFPLIAAGVLLRMLLVGRGATLREGLSDAKERLGRPQLPPSRPRARVAWFHAASVGEVAAAAALIGRLLDSKAKMQVIVTTSTAAGRAKARLIPGISGAYLAPMDFYPAVSAFLSRVRPDSLILVETELWPMLLWTARRRGVRLGIANGRITERAFGRYKLLRGPFSRVLSAFERVAAQSEADAARFIALGVPGKAVSRAGNMKYDLGAPDEEQVARAKGCLKNLGWNGDPVWVAGSTWRGEEDQVLTAHLRVCESVPGTRLVLAPRHSERADETAAALIAKGISFVRLSELERDGPSSGETACLLIDRLGVLGAFYAAGRLAFIGGSLVPVGGHNLLEPAALGKPVLFGPFTASTSETAEALKIAGGACVSDERELTTTLLDFLQDPGKADRIGRDARATAASFAGATARTFEHLCPLF